MNFRKAMPEPAKDWRLIRPDFSDRDKYEREGWNRIEAWDLSIWHEQLMWGAVGASDPKDKFARVHTYHNSDLDLFAVTFDVFDQGVALIAWSKNRETILTGGNSIGAALLVNGVWVLKKLDDVMYMEVSGVSPPSANQPMAVLIQFGFIARSGSFYSNISLEVKRAKE